jgi:hypothetical protein
MELEPKIISELDAASINAFKEVLSIKKYIARCVFDYGAIIKYSEISDFGEIDFVINTGFVESVQSLFPNNGIGIPLIGTDFLNENLFNATTLINEGKIQMLPVGMDGVNIPIPDEGEFVIQFVFPGN